MYLHAFFMSTLTCDKLETPASLGSFVLLFSQLHIYIDTFCSPGAHWAFFSSPDTVIFHYDNRTYYISLRSEKIKKIHPSLFLLCDAVFLIMVSGGRGLSLLSANQKQSKITK